MERLIKQTRAIFSDTQQVNKERRSTLDRTITPQRTQEKKRSESWMRRQFSRQMSQDNDFGGEDYTTAIAAAAYAIQSLDESIPKDRNERTSSHEKSFNKMKSEAEGTQILPELQKSAPKFSDETPKPSFKDPDIKKPISTSTSKKLPEEAVGPRPSIKKEISSSDTDETTSDESENREFEKPPERSIFMERPPTSADKHLYISETERPATPVPKPDRLPTGFSTTQSVDPRRQSATKPGPGVSMADAWEKEEMASIKERYEMLRATIDNWEIKKKEKANHKLEMTQAKLEKKRAEAVKSHRNEIRRIEEIAGARAEADLTLRTTIENWATKKKKNANRKLERTEAKLEKKRAKAVNNHRSEMTRIKEIAEGARAQAKENRRNEEFKVKDKANIIRSTGKLPEKCLCF